MCGRVIQASPPELLRLKILDGLDGRDNRIKTDLYGNVPPRYNGAPGQDLWVIRRNPATGEHAMDLLRWGLIPHFATEKPKPPPINARAESIARLSTFRQAYAKRRCIVPIDGFFEWRAIKGTRQPYAIAMADRSPFGVAGLWEAWKDPATGDWLRTFCVITVPVNSLVGRIHDRMPAILAPADYERWLSDEPDPRDLLRPYPAEALSMWPVSTRVNSWQNDDPSLVEPVPEGRRKSLGV